MQTIGSNTLVESRSASAPDQAYYTFSGAEQTSQPEISNNVPYGLPRYGVNLPLPTGESLNLLLAASVPTELIRGSKVCPIPNRPVWFLGMINLRGNLVPVFDLVQSCLDIAKSSGSKNLLAIGVDEQAFAIPIDNEPRLLSLQKIESLPLLIPPEFQQFSGAAYLSEGTYWYEFMFEHWLTQLFQGTIRGRSVRRTSFKEGVPS